MYSKRIRELAKLIDKDSVVLDVGTDHAYLPILLMDKRIVKKVYAADISKNALDIAKKNIEKTTYDIKTILSDGLKGVKVKYDTLVIAGMGYSTIKGILSVDNLPNTILLQTNSDHYLMRVFMNEIGYKIEKEVVFIDKKIYYVLIKYVKGVEKLKGKYLMYGKSNNREYFEYLLNREKEILQNIPFRKKYIKLKNIIYLKSLLKENR